MSRDFFRVFGLAPRYGRVFIDEELRPGAPPSVIVSHAFWQNRLDASPQTLGKTLKIGTRLLTIVGVMPPDMNYPAGTELWLPQEIEQQTGSRTTHGWRVVAARESRRVACTSHIKIFSAVSKRSDSNTATRPGCPTPSRDAARTARRQSAHDVFRSARRVGVPAAHRVRERRQPARRAHDHPPQRDRTPPRARREPRAVVAAVPHRDGGALSFLGAFGGVLLAAVGVRVLSRCKPASFRAPTSHVNWPVMLFALGVAFIAAVALGLFTAWHGTRGDIRESFGRRSARRPARRRHGSGGRSSSRKWRSPSSCSSARDCLAAASCTCWTSIPAIAPEQAVVLTARDPVRGWDRRQRSVASRSTRPDGAPRRVAGRAKVGAVERRSRSSAAVRRRIHHHVAPDEPMNMAGLSELLRDQDAQRLRELPRRRRQLLRRDGHSARNGRTVQRAATRRMRRMSRSSARRSRRRSGRTRSAIGKFIHTATWTATCVRSR